MSLRDKSLCPTINKTINMLSNSPFDNSDAPIAAVDFSGLDPYKIIDIQSYTDDIYENSDEFYKYEKLIKSGEIYLSSYYNLNDIVVDKSNFLITDIIKNEPLFYQYELLYHAGGQEEDNVIKIYKNNTSLVENIDYIIQYDYSISNTFLRYQNTSIWTSVFKNDKQQHKIRILFPNKFAAINDFYVIKYNKIIGNGSSYQEELIELKPLYLKNIDFTINNSEISIVSTSKINKTQNLYFIKNIDDQIKIKGIDPQFFSAGDTTSSWKLRITPGSIDVNNDFYYIKNQISTDNIPITLTNIKPINLYGNIVQLSQYPIYINNSSMAWPNYEIQVYDSLSTKNNEDLGKISININGKFDSSIKILSIDSRKGFIMLNKTLNIRDEIEFNFYVESNKYLFLDNIEFNPKLSSIIQIQNFYKISSYPNGLGLAIRPYDNNNVQQTECIYIYKIDEIENERLCYPIFSKGTQISIINPINWNDDKFISIGEIFINKLNKNFIKLSDARRIGGGVLDNVDLKKIFDDNNKNIKELDWYIGKAFYGGEPLSHSGLIIINIPKTVIDTERNKWIRHYNSEEKGINEFNFYIDQVITRYISAGSFYIIIPTDENGNFLDILDLGI